MARARPLHFTLHELDLSSWGTVTAIEPCPPIAPGQGQVVTGRFTTRQVEEITRVQLEDGTELSGTPVHPVWSVDRQDWIPLGGLQPAERLLSRRGEVAVIAVTTSLWRQPVYNLEVHGEHVYEVADAGVLVHNSYESKALGNALEKAGHIRPPFKVKGKSYYEAAHIAPTKGWDWLTDVQKVELQRIQQNLREWKLMNAAENGFWATSGHLGTHTKEYVADLLKAFSHVGDAAAARIALDAMRGKIMNGRYI